MGKKESVLNPVELRHVSKKQTFIADINLPSDKNGCPKSLDINVIGFKQNKITKNPTKKDEIKLKKSISFFSCFTIIFAATGHVSVFVSPSAIIQSSGSVGASLFIWIIGGLINLMQALCFVELGTIFPKAGGPYVHIFNIFGPLPAFLILWGYMIFIAGPAWAIMGETAAIYLLKPAFTDCDPPAIAVKILAAWIIVSVVALNSVYMKFTTKIQSFFTICKILALTIVIIGGFILLARGNYENLERPFESTSHEAGEIAMAIFYSIFSYGGWQTMTSLMEEMKNPARDLPIAVNLAFFVVILKYILTNVAYYLLLSPSEMANLNSIAISFMDGIYRPLSPLVAVLVALASIGTLNVLVMSYPRMLFAGARMGHAPKLLGMLHERFKVPWPSTFVLCTWSLIMLFYGDLYLFMDYISLQTCFVFLLMSAAVICHRWKAPKVHRPYKVNILIPIFQIFISIALWGLAIHQKPHRMGTGMAILFCGIPIYWLGVLWKDKPADFSYFMEHFTVTCQKIFLLRMSS